MGLMDVLSVIIGLIFIWMLLGVAVMQIQEWTVGWMSLRADSLEDAIQGMLLAPKRRRGPWGRFSEQLKKRGFTRWLSRSIPWLKLDMPPMLVQEFYLHPLVRSLEQQRAKPSYLSAEIFSRVLIDTIMIAGLDAHAIHNALLEMRSQQPGITDKSISEKLDALTNLANKVALNRALEETTDSVKRQALQASAQAVGADAPPNTLADLRRELGMFRALLQEKESDHSGAEMVLSDLLESMLRAQLPSDVEGVWIGIEHGSNELLAISPLLQQRLAFLARQITVEADEPAAKLALFRGELRGWFDETMNHVTGWYKRNRQWGAFAIGLLIAAFLNLDSIQISTELWRQPALREALSAAVQEFNAQALETEVQLTGGAVEQLEESLTELQVPIGWHFALVTEYDPASQACVLFPDGSSGEVGGLSWKGQCYQWQDVPKRWGILTKLIGIVITAAAAMQGAPFWFDVLDKIVPIRTAGIRPKAVSTMDEDGESGSPSSRPPSPTA